MLRIEPMDQRVPIFSQMDATSSPVILINKFTVDPAEADQLIKAWTEDAEFMKRQPGFISTQLHRGIAGSAVFLNYAVWESVAAFRDAFSHSEFKAALSRYPSSAVASPHLFEKVAIAGICEGQ